MRKVKILYIIESLDRGGAERRLVNDIKCLNRNEFESIICTLRKSETQDDFTPAANSYGVQVICLNLAPKCKFSLRKLFSLINIIYGNSVDIIHSQLFFSDLYTALSSFLFRNKLYIRTLQSTVYINRNTPFFSRKRYLIDRYLITKRFKANIVVSEIVKKMALMDLKADPKRTELIYNSVNSNFFSKPSLENIHKLKKELGIHEHTKILLSVGRFAPEKGHSVLLYAIKELIQNNTHVKLILIGRGCQRSTRQLVGKLNIDHDVILLGEKPNIKDYLDCCDYFIFPSLEGEGLPVALLEAMSVGKICIAADTEPIREIIKHGSTGYLYSRKNERELAQIIMELISKKEKTTVMATTCKQFILNNFLDRHCTRKLENVYRLLLSQNREYSNDSLRHTSRK